MDTALGIVVRWALVADLMLLFGVPLFAIYIAPDAVAKTGPALRALVLASASVGILLSVLGIAILAATMSGAALGDVDLAGVTMLVTATAVGTAFLVRIAALAASFALALRLQGNRANASLIMLSGAIALGSLAWSGHGVMDDGRTGVIHLVADIVHLLSAGTWVGALGALLWLLVHTRRDDGAASHTALAGFATLGTVSVGLVVISGSVNAWLLVGPAHFLSIGATLYGQLLLLKLALFAGMLALAALNRLHLTPTLAAAANPGQTDRATRRLRLSLAAEMLSAIVILGLVAWLGSLEPPIAMI